MAWAGAWQPPEPRANGYHRPLCLLKTLPWGQGTMVWAGGGLASTWAEGREFPQAPVLVEDTLLETENHALSKGGWQTPELMTNRCCRPLCLLKTLLETGGPCLGQGPGNHLGEGPPDTTGPCAYTGRPWGQGALLLSRGLPNTSRTVLWARGRQTPG